MDIDKGEKEIDLSNLLRDFELLVHNKGTRAAIKEMEEYRQTRKPIVAFHFIMEHTSRPEVLMQAVLCFRDVLMREWQALGEEQLTNIRQFLLEYPSKQRQRLPINVRRLMFATAAAMLKRGWQSLSLGDVNQSLALKVRFFGHLLALLTAPDAGLKHDGVLLAAEVLTQMAGTRDAVRLNIPLSYHLRAKVSFENVYLPQMLLALLPLAEQYCYPDSGAPEEFVLAVINTVSDIFSWTFGSREADRDNDGVDSDDEDAGASDVVFMPTAAWRPLLVENHNVMTLFIKLYAAWRLHTSDVAQALALCLAPLATLSGEVFNNPAQQVGYLITLLRGVCALMQPLNGRNIVAPNEALVISQMLVRVGRNFPIPAIAAASQSVADHGQSSAFFDELLRFTLRVFDNVQYLVAQSDSLDEENMDGNDDLEHSSDLLMNAALDLLETWLLFSAPPEDSEPSAAPSPFAAQAETIFRGYLATRLALAASELHSDDGIEDEESEDETRIKDRIQHHEELAAAVHIGRLAPSPCVRILVQALSEARGELERSLSDPAEGGSHDAMEKLHWLTLISGYFMADVGSSEISEIPHSLFLASQNAIPLEDPILALSNCIFGIVELENQCIFAGKMKMWSPLLAESLIWFLNRWASTYMAAVLSLDQRRVTRNLVDAFGGSEPCTKILEFFMRKVTLNLIGWKSEIEACNLLNTIISQLKVREEVLTALPAWKNLFEAHCSLDSKLATLPSPVHRRLIEALVSLPIATENEARRNEYLQLVLRPIESSFAAFLQTGNIQLKTGDPLTILAVWSHLDRLRGVVRGARKNSAVLIWNFISPMLTSLHGLMKIFMADHATVMSILQLWTDLVSRLVEILPRESKDQLFEAIGQLISVCKEANWVLPKSKKRAKDIDLVLYQKLNKLAKLLKAIAIFPDAPKSAQMTFFGLAVLSPSITPEMLQYPKLSRNYFQLLNSATRSYAFAIPKLPEFLFSTVWTSLASSLVVSDNDHMVIRAALEAVVHLVEPALALRAEKKDFFTPAHGKILTEVIPQLLDNIVTSTWVFAENLRAAASDAFLACVLLNVDLSQRWAVTLVDKVEPSLRTNISEPFERLFRSVNPADPDAFGRQARLAFVPSFESFVAASHAFLRNK